MKQFLTPFDVCYCRFCGVTPTLLQFLICCYLLGLNGFSCCWKAQRKKERRKKGECAFKLAKGSMRSFELNKGNILPEETKKIQIFEAIISACCFYWHFASCLKQKFIPQMGIINKARFYFPSAVWGLSLLWCQTNAIQIGAMDPGFCYLFF